MGFFELEKLRYTIVDYVVISLLRQDGTGTGRDVLKK